MDFETYERVAWADYAAFAQAVSSILKAAIRTDNNLRLQDVTYRHKAPDSLKRKLEERNLTSSTTMENDIKDLAGCRIIFYTNDDVSQFMNSGLMHDNFAIIEVKVHHPNRDTETAAELYMANHYVVKLRPEREALPEYARFAGMRCEVQVHTILNHAWAEIAHDMLYKKPRLNGFGGSAFASIDGRMHKVMRKYLLPAGYEFQKILRDFERLCLGKDLFDRGALDAIIHAKDNNERADVLERFSEHVLPSYDDVQSEYPQIVQALVNAATIARNVPVVEIETPYGSFPGKTAGDITRAVAEILGTYRYVDVELTFDALCEIFLSTASEDERKPLLKVTESLSKYELQVWNSYGPAVQAMLISRLKKLPSDQLRRLQPLLIVILREILKTQVTGTSSTSSTFTWHTGAVVASETLPEIRHDAIGLLKQLFHITQTDVDRRTVLDALAEATRTPSMGMYSNQLVGIILRDAGDTTSYYAEIARNLSYELLQVLESRILQLYRCFRTLPSDMANDPVLTKTRDELVDSIQTFRDGINSDRSFVIFKTLVGFDSVFPPAWENDQFDYQQAAAYRNERLGELLNDVEETNSEEWFAIITRCAATQSNDRAAFWSFGEFLIRLGETKPDILMGYLDRMDQNLCRFLPATLNGLVKSPCREIVLTKVDEWVDGGQYLSEIACYLRSNEP